MTFAELQQTEGWKKFMAKLYGIGAAVVIVGALFKIQHWPGAGPMLIAGLSTEAVIFIFSAFEPLHEEDDWSLVFPQLAGIDPEDELHQTPITSGVAGSGGSGMSKLDELLLANIDSGEELFKKLGKGLENLSNTTNSLADISNATVATKKYAANVEAAAESMSNFKNSAEAIAGSSEALVGSYQKLSASLQANESAIKSGSGEISTQIANLGKNMSALNAVYELQLESTNNQYNKSQELYSGLDKVIGNLQQSIDGSKKYTQEVDKLGEKLAALNNVYGNMLSAMNVKLG